MAYATLAELRNYVGIPVSDTADDALLQIALDASTSQIENYTGRFFTIDGAPTVRYYTADAAGSVTIDQVQTSTGLVVQTDDNFDGVHETTWTLDTDFFLYPYNAPSFNEPWTRLVRSTSGTKSFPTRPRAVKVTAKYGWTTPPAAIKQACLQQAARLFARRQSPYGVAGSPELGSEVRLLARLDPDVEALLRPFRRTWIVVSS